MFDFNKDDNIDFDELYLEMNLVNDEEDEEDEEDDDEDDEEDEEDDDEEDEEDDDDDDEELRELFSDFMEEKTGYTDKRVELLGSEFMKELVDFGQLLIDKIMQMQKELMKDLENRPNLTSVNFNDWLNNYKNKEALVQKLLYIHSAICDDNGFQ